MALYRIDHLPYIHDKHVIWRVDDLSKMRLRPEYFDRKCQRESDKITHVQRGVPSVTMPPRDHYVVQFDHKDMRTLRGRVYDTMIDFDYSQLGEGILPATNDIHRGIRKTQVPIPTAGHLYVACLNDSTKEISYLIEINRFEADDIVNRLNVSADIRPKQH